MLRRNYSEDIHHVGVCPSCQRGAIGPGWSIAEHWYLRFSRCCGALRGTPSSQTYAVCHCPPASRVKLSKYQSSCSSDHCSIVEAHCLPVVSLWVSIRWCFRGAGLQEHLCSGLHVVSKEQYEMAVFRQVRHHFALWTTMDPSTPVNSVKGYF